MKIIHYITRKIIFKKGKTYIPQIFNSILSKNKKLGAYRLKIILIKYNFKIVHPALYLLKYIQILPINNKICKAYIFLY